MPGMSLALPSPRWLTRRIRLLSVDTGRRPRGGRLPRRLDSGAVGPAVLEWHSAASEPARRRDATARTTRLATVLLGPSMLDLDHWLSSPTICVAHRRVSIAAPDGLWKAACGVRLSDASLLGRLVRWRIPGLEPDLSFDSLFRHNPFLVLVGNQERALVSGLVGRIWTLRRDYPQLSDPEEFRRWSVRGTARVLFANWVEPLRSGGAVLRSETRVQAIGSQGRFGLATLRPVVRAAEQLIATEGLEQAVRRAERE